MVSVRAPSHSSDDATPMEARMAGDHMTHAGGLWLDCASDVLVHVQW